MIIKLQKKQDLEQILDRSQREPVFIFKHSTQCSRSADVIEDFRDFEKANPGIVCGLVLVLEDRAISDDIEDRFAIRHESPQAILLSRGAPVWHASHRAITEAALASALGAVHA